MMKLLLHYNALRGLLATKSSVYVKSRSGAQPGLHGAGHAAADRLAHAAQSERQHERREGSARPHKRPNAKQDSGDAAQRQQPPIPSKIGYHGVLLSILHLIWTYAIRGRERQASSYETARAAFLMSLATSFGCDT